MKRGRPRTDSEEPQGEVPLAFPVTITSIKPQQGIPGRFSVLSDQGFVLGLNREVLLESGLSVGQNLDRERYESLRTREHEDGVRRKLLSWLSSRDHTRFELVRKVDQRFGQVQGLDGMLDRMEQLGLIDEHRYAERFVKERTERRGWGEFKIREEMKKRGLPPDVIDKALGAGMDEHEAAEACKSALEKKKWYFERIVDPSSRKRSMASHLQRRGFPPGVIRRVLSDPNLFS